MLASTSSWSFLRGVSCLPHSGTPGADGQSSRASCVPLISLWSCSSGASKRADQCKCRGSQLKASTQEGCPDEAFALLLDLPLPLPLRSGILVATSSQAVCMAFAAGQEQKP